MTEHRNEESEPVVVRDRRRIDPRTGEVRAPEDASATEAASGPAEPAEDSPAEAASPDPADQKLAELTAQLDERTADLQRVTAEYANYRRRVDRDREVIALSARAQVLGELLPVLDDLDRAEAHGDLTGAFKAVSDKLVSALTSVGLEPFGAEGEPFDPTVHEAVQHSTSPDASGPTVATVLRRGYRIGERILRPAMVAVVDREAGASDAPEPGRDAAGPAAESGEAVEGESARTDGNSN